MGEVARRAEISMATAQRYKKLYQDRIPSEGKGRRQRYPAAAVSVFKELKKERFSRRPRKPARTAGTAAGRAALLTLSSISAQTGISYPTLQRYVKLFSDRIPHEGEGRKRRYHPEAVPVFRQLRAESKPGRKAKTKPPKAPARNRRKARAKADPGGGRGPKLLTLTAIGEQTGISSPTLRRYLKLHGDRIPSEGEGRKRRYHPEAVAVFREIRSRSRRGRKPQPKAVDASPVTAEAPPETQKARDAKVGDEAVSVAVRDQVEAGPVETRGEVEVVSVAVRDQLEAGPAETRGEVEAASVAVRDQLEAGPAETRGEVEVVSVAVRDQLEARLAETEGHVEARLAAARDRVEARLAETQGQVEARLAALEAQVSQVLKKLDEPFTITLRADRQR